MKLLFKILSFVVTLSIVVSNAYDAPESWSKRVQENKQRSKDALAKNLNTALESAIQLGQEVFSVALSEEDLIFNEEATLIASVYEKARKDLAALEYIFDYEYKCGRMQIPCSLRWEKTVLSKK